MTINIDFDCQDHAEEAFMILLDREWSDIAIECEGTSIDLTADAATLRRFFIEVYLGSDMNDSDAIEQWNDYIS